MRKKMLQNTLVVIEETIAARKAAHDRAGTRLAVAARDAVQQVLDAQANLRAALDLAGIAPTSSSSVLVYNDQAGDEEEDAEAEPEDEPDGDEEEGIPVVVATGRRALPRPPAKRRTAATA